MATCQLELLHVGVTVIFKTPPRLVMNWKDPLASSSPLGCAACVLAKSG